MWVLEVFRVCISYIVLVSFLSTRFESDGQYDWFSILLSPALVSTGQMISLSHFRIAGLLRTNTVLFIFVNRFQIVNRQCCWIYFLKKSVFNSPPQHTNSLHMKTTHNLIEELWYFADCSKQKM